MTGPERESAAGTSDGGVEPQQAIALPMSLAQQRLWLIEQLEPGRASYHVPLVCRLRGPLNVQALEQALNQVIARHEVLRTTFDKVDSSAAQIIAPALTVPIEVDDLSGLAVDERTVRANAEAHAHITRPFDLRRGPLLRAHLLRMDADEHILVLVLHHIICDGWSFGVMMSEMSRFYRGIVTRHPITLDELPIQYADYAQWQRDQLQGETLERLIGYWKTRLRDAPVMELPSDLQRPGALSGEGGSARVMLPDSLRASLQQLATTHQVSMFMVVLTAFKVLLARYTGQHDVVVGSPITGRTQAELEPLIGFFANMLVLRTDLTGEPSFIDTLRRVRETVLDAHDHQELPFEKLVEELRPRRDRSHHPLFQIAFLYSDGPPHLPDLPGVDAALVPFEMGTAKFDLLLSVANRPDGLHCRIEYSSDLFTEPSMRAMLTHLHVLLASIVADPNAPISRLPLLSDDERRTVVHHFNDTARAYPRDSTIDALFEAQAERTPEATALIDGSQTISYRALAERARAVSEALAQHGVKQGDRVAICLQRGGDLVASLLGILRCGAAYVPLDPEYPIDRLRFMLDDAQARLVIVDDTAPQALRAASTESDAAATCVPVDALTRTDATAAPLPSAPDRSADDLAYLMFTSGSTGTPKAVAVPHRGVVRLVMGAEYVPFGPDQRFLLLAPVSFDASTLELWGPLLHGGVCVIYPHRVPQLDQLEATIREQRITCLWLTAAMFNTVIDQRPAALTGVRHLLIGGEALSLPHVRQAQKALPDTRIINGYGPTESTTFTCTWPIPRDLPPNAVSVPIGCPIANTQTYVLDDHRQPTPIGVPGELYIGGDGLARGYWNRPELTEQRFVPDPFSADSDRKLYRTGDRCRWRHDGTLEFLGRLDQQVKLRGFRIELGEIEAALAQHPAVRQCVVIVHGRGNDRRLVAYVVPDGSMPAHDALQNHLKRMLPAYMLPAAFVRISAVPLTPVGKINRAALPEPVFAGDHGDTTTSQPRDAVERDLVELWSRVLKTERVGVHDNFFALGGHSLAAVGMFDQISQRFGKSLPLAMLFDHPTIAQLAPLLRDDREVPRAPILVPLKTEGSRLPFYFVHGIGGDLVFLKPLAEALPDDQPLFGLRAMGTDEREEPDADIASMARRYLDAIRTVQPAGPYHIGGFSSGGTIAFEMAQQLLADGQDVGLLAVFDHAPLHVGGRRPTWHPARLARWIYNLPFYVVDDLLRPARKVNAVSRVKGKLRVWREKVGHRMGLAKPAESRLDFQAMFGVTTLSDHRKRFLQMHYDALRNYRPQPYAGRVTVFRARTRPLFQTNLPEARWRHIAQQVVTHVIPGSHEGMFRRPHVERIARALAEHLHQP